MDKLDNGSSQRQDGDTDVTHLESITGKPKIIFQEAKQGIK